MLRYLLDTNIVISTLKRRPIEVLDAFNKNADRMAISSITLSAATTTLASEWFTPIVFFLIVVRGLHRASLLH